jgi:quercetin 2,3-dioxygenase
VDDVHPVRRPPSDLAPETRLVPAATRFTTRSDWLLSRHSFSFGRHYDPANTHHGLLLVNNEDVVGPRSGFGDHAHAETEIVTWVLSGALTHEDSTGHRGVVRPGVAQRMSAGSGIVHAERNESDEPVHFVQMWVAPGDAPVEPGYEQAEIGDLAGRGLVTVASGRDEDRDRAAVRIVQPDAALHAVRLARDEAAVLPSAPYLHVFATRGEVELSGVGRIGAGDAVRVTGGDGHRLRGVGDGEVLVWEMHAALAT